MSQGPPNVVGAFSYPLAYGVFGGRPGPYANGSDLWIVCAQVSSAIAIPYSVPQNLSAYKSTDGGATYTLIATGPQVVAKAVFPIALGSASAATVSYRGSGTVIDIGYQDETGQLSAITFDMGSETFGTVNPTGVTLSLGDPLGFGSLGNLVLLRQPSDDLVMLWVDSVLGGGVYALTFSGASWSGPVAIRPNGALFWFLDNAVIDGDGNVGVLMSQSNGGSFANVRVGQKFYVRFSGASVLSTTTTPLGANADLPFSVGFIAAPIYDSTSDRVAFPLVRNVLTGGVNVPTVTLLVGGPSAAPIFQIVNVHAQGDSTPQWAQISGSGTSFTSTWYRRTQTAQDIIEQSSAPSLTGPWGAPILYWNENTDPPTPLPYFDGIRPIYSNQIPSGSIGVIVGLSTHQLGGAWFCIPYTWAPTSGPAPPPPTMGLLRTEVVVVGAPGVDPAQWTLSASGPSPQSGAGGFGPMSILPGTYILTQNNIAGYTTVFGLSGGGTLAGNVLTVAPGDNAVVTVTNTFISGQTLAVNCLPNYTVGVFYDRFIVATGGVPPYTFSITGTLPTGLTLNASTGEVSGICNDPGPFSFTITVTDSS